MKDNIDEKIKDDELIKKDLKLINENNVKDRKTLIQENIEMGKIKNEDITLFFEIDKDEVFYL